MQLIRIRTLVPRDLMTCSMNKPPITHTLVFAASGPRISFIALRQAERALRDDIINDLGVNFLMAITILEE
jgi:hypothetical protein